MSCNRSIVQPLAVFYAQRNSRENQRVEKLRAKRAEKQAELRRLFDVLRAHFGECHACGVQCPHASYRLDPELLKDLAL